MIANKMENNFGLANADKKRNLSSLRGALIITASIPKIIVANVKSSQ